MQPLQLFDPGSSTYTYVVFDPSNREAIVIDPVDSQWERDLAVLRQYQLTLRWSVETHVHTDRAPHAPLLATHTGAQSAAPRACGLASAAMQLEDGASLRFGDETLTALHTPGHTQGSMCYRWRDHVFTGDTLLINGCGRTDFPSGSSEALHRSLTQVLFRLPDSTMVWPGHDYLGHTHSTIGIERTRNPRVAGKTLDEFVAVMQALNPPHPRRADAATPTTPPGHQRHDAGGGTAHAVLPAPGYAGDISATLAYAWWQSGDAVLVDVRTDAEREWVGFIPGAVALAWKQWPGMTMNPGFDSGLLAAVPADKKAVLLCRSGVRSVAAAKRATELGVEAYNILEGFEGDPDAQAHRGNKGGWRLHGLPWRQG